MKDNYDEFWKEIVENPDGTINKEQLKKELEDFSFLMDQVPKIYCHITGNILSKLNYKAETVIQVSDEYQDRWHKEENLQTLDYLLSAEAINKKTYNLLLKHLT